VLRLEQAPEDVDRLERCRDGSAPAAAAVEPVPVPNGPERGDEPERHRNRPGQRQGGIRLPDPVREQQHRRDGRSRREQRVFERAEPEHAHARLTVRYARLAEGVQVDGKAATGDERTEAGADSRRSRPRVHARAFLDAGDLAVAQHVADVGDRLRPERHEEPDRVDLTEPARDVVETGHPRDREERPERDQGACNDEHEGLGSSPLEVGFTCEHRHRHPHRTHARMHR
jgi:hypothetical protein